MKSLLKAVYYRLPQLCNTGLVFPCRNYTIELTYRCNLNCRMCSYLREIRLKNSEIRDQPELTSAEWKQVFAQFPVNSNIALTGGEIFVKQDIWVLLEYAASRARLTLGTNGFLIDDDAAGRIVKAGVIAVGVSVDGTETVHNTIRNNPRSYGKALNALHLLKLARAESGNLYPVLNVNTVILPENLDCLALLPEIARQAGADSLSFQVLDPSLERSGSRLRETVDLSVSPMAPLPIINRDKLTQVLLSVINRSRELGLNFTFSPSGSLDDILDYYQGRLDLDRWQCRMPYLSTRISPYGDVFPCLNQRIGNTRDLPLAKLINHATYRGFRRKFGQGLIFPACAGCCKMEPRS